MEWKTDCRHFLGDKPCRFRRTCPECPHYDPIGQRILVVKLAAVGDVLRTTPLLPALKEQFPRSQITWISRPSGVEVLENLPEIDRLLATDLDNVVGLQAERFDRVYCLDKEPLATGLAMTVAAEHRLGFGRNPAGALVPLNPGSRYAYALGLDDQLKFRDNQKTYPQIVFEMAELEYRGQRYQFRLRPEEERFGRDFATCHGLNPERLTIGINTGCGEAFQMKKWPLENIVEFINLAGRALEPQILLYGGPREVERNREIQARADYPVVDTGCGNTIRQFAGLVNLCDVLVTGDTLAMHLAIALEKFVVLLIGSTSWTEIDLFGRGVKMVTDFPCAPCYLRTCDLTPWCLQAMRPAAVLEAMMASLERV